MEFNSIYKSSFSRKLYKGSFHNVKNQRKKSFLKSNNLSDLRSWKTDTTRHKALKNEIFSNRYKNKKGNSKLKKHKFKSTIDLKKIKQNSSKEAKGYLFCPEKRLKDRNNSKKKKDNLMSRTKYSDSVQSIFKISKKKVIKDSMKSSLEEDKQFCLRNQNKILNIMNTRKTVNSNKKRLNIRRELTPSLNKKNNKIEKNLYKNEIEKNSSKSNSKKDFKIKNHNFDFMSFIEKKMQTNKIQNLNNFKTKIAQNNLDLTKTFPKKKEKLLTSEEKKKINKLENCNKIGIRDKVNDDCTQSLKKTNSNERKNPSLAKISFYYDEIQFDSNRYLNGRNSKNTISLNTRISSNQIRQFFDTNSINGNFNNPSGFKVNRFNFENQKNILEDLPTSEKMSKDGGSKGRKSKEFKELKRQLNLIYNPTSVHNPIQLEVKSKKKKKLKKNNKAKQILNIDNNKTNTSENVIKSLLKLFPWFDKSWLLTQSEDVISNTRKTWEKIFIRFFSFLECVEQNEKLKINLKLNLIPLSEKWYIKVLGIEEGLIRLIFIFKKDLFLNEVHEKPAKGNFCQVVINPKQDSRVKLEILNQENSQKCSKANNFIEKGLLGLAKSIFYQNKKSGFNNESFYLEFENGNSTNNNGKGNSVENVLDELREETDEGIELDQFDGISLFSLKKEIKKSFYIDIQIEEIIFNYLFEKIEIKAEKNEKNINKIENKNIFYYKWKPGISKCFYNCLKKEVYTNKGLNQNLKKWKQEFEKNDEPIQSVSFSHRSMKRQLTNRNIVSTSLKGCQFLRSKTQIFAPKKGIQRVKTEEIKNTNEDDKKTDLSIIQESNWDNLSLKNTFYDHDLDNINLQNLQNQIMRKEPMDFENKDDLFNLFLAEKKNISVFDLQLLLQNILFIISHFEIKTSRKSNCTNEEILHGKINFSSNVQDFNFFIRSNKRLFIWLDSELKDLNDFQKYQKINKKLNGKILSKSTRIQKYLEDCFINKIKKEIKNGKSNINFPILGKGKKEIIYFNPNEEKENIKIWVKKICQNQSHQKSISNTNSIIMYMNELPNDSALFINSQIGESHGNTSICISKSKTEINQNSQNSLTNIMFTIYEIKFDSKEKKEQIDSRLKIFIVSKWNFELMVEEEPIVLFSDLENFFSCQCRVELPENTPSDYSLEVSSSKRIPKLQINEIDPCSLRRITSIQEFSKKNPFLVESPKNTKNLVQNICPDTPNLDISNPCENLQIRHMSLNIPLIKKNDSFSNNLLGSEGNLIRRKSDFSKKTKNSSKQIIFENKNQSYMKCQKNIYCYCNKSATQSNFDFFWEELLKDNKIGTLIELLIKAKVQVFRLDSKVLDS